METLSFSRMGVLEGGGWSVTYPTIPDADCTSLYFEIKDHVFGPLPAWLPPLESIPAHCLATGGGISG